MACKWDKTGTLHINRPDNIRRTMTVEKKWCFDCRKHLKHRLHWIDDAWYDPEFFWKCAGCGHDRTLFPGREYE